MAKLSIPLAALALGACATTAEMSSNKLPEPAFAIDRTRSDPHRRTRDFRAPYGGPLYDVQAHLRRPDAKRYRTAIPR